MSRQTLLQNRLACAIGAMKLKSVLGNINAQYANSHVDLSSEVKVHQTKSSLEGVIVKSGVQGSESSGDLINLCYLDSISKFDSSNHLCQVIESA